MKHLLRFTLRFLLIICLNVAAVAQIQLVESVPVETNLGIAETDRTLEVWLDMINGAEERIDIETFYFSAQEGEPLDQVIDALESAAGRGVQIRIIADAKFADIYPQTLNSLDSLENIEVRRISFFNEMDGVQHAKYFIVDGKDLFLGSQNFDWRSLKHIHELGIRIQHKQLAEFILQVFDLDWQLCQQRINFENLEKMSRLFVQLDHDNPISIEWGDEEHLVYPIFSPQGYMLPGMAFEEDEILRLINSAEEKVHIQLLSYNPAYDNEYYATLDDALRSAAARGVQVRLLVSDWNKRKPGVDYLKSLQALPNIEVKFSAIPQYSEGFIPYARVEHCKYMIVDDNLAWIGTSNWAKNYFYASRNLGLIIKSKEINSTVQKIFLKSWDSHYAEILEPTKEYEAPRIGE